MRGAGWDGENGDITVPLLPAFRILLPENKKTLKPRRASGFYFIVKIGLYEP
jgi:hypothetical protein